MENYKSELKGILDMIERNIQKATIAIELNPMGVSLSDESIKNAINDCKYGFESIVQLVEKHENVRLSRVKIFKSTETMNQFANDLLAGDITDYILSA